MYANIAGIYSEDVDLERERYGLFFSFSNVVAILRAKEENGFLERSEDGKIIFYGSTSKSNPELILMDLIFKAKIGSVDLLINDVVILRVNGQLTSYRFHGLISRFSSSSAACFDRLNGFIEAERWNYIRHIHSTDRVLSVLDGKVLHLSNINLAKTIPCAIDGKIFQAAGDSVMSDYSLYVYDNGVVKFVDPEQKPFLRIDVALQFFNQKKYQKQPLLLLNRSELEMVRDYHQLQRLAFA